MASSYSPKLRFELIAPGEQAGLWGDTTNENIGTLIEQAIAGVANIDLAAKSGDLVLEAKEGAEDQARSAVLSCFGTAAGDVNLVIPSSTKLYVVRNSSSKDVYVKTASQTLGTRIKSGEANLVFCDGANALAGIVIAGASVTPVGSGGTGVGSPGFTAGYLKSPGGTTAFATVSGIPVADIVGQLTIGQGGTGIPTAPAAGQILIGTTGGGYALGSITGTGGVTVSNTSGAIQIGYSGTSGGVTSVSALSPLASSGGTTPQISISSNPTFSSGVTAPYHYVGSSAGSTYIYDNGGQIQFMVSGVPSAKVTTAGLGTENLVANGIVSSVNAGGYSALQSNNIGIGSSVNTISSTGSGNIFYFNVGGSFASVYFSTGGNFQASNSPSWSTVSDTNIKTNVRSITSALDKLKSLNPIHFEYKDNLGKTQTGFIAQEFETIFPGHVIEDEAPEKYKQYLPEGQETIKALDLNLTAYLVKAIQELNTKVDAQAAKITALEEQVLNLSVK